MVFDTEYLSEFKGGFAEWLGDDAFDWDFYGRWLEPKCEPTARASSPKAVELDWDPDNEAESLALVRRISAEDAAARDAASVAVMRGLLAKDLRALLSLPLLERLRRGPLSAAEACYVIAAGLAPPPPLPPAEPWKDGEVSIAVGGAPPAPGVGRRVAFRAPPIRRRSAGPSTARRRDPLPPARSSAAPPPRRSAVAGGSAAKVDAIVPMEAHVADLRSLGRVVQPGREGRGARPSAYVRRQLKRAERAEKARVEEARRRAAAADAEAERVAAEACVVEERRRAAAADAEAKRVAEAEAARDAEERRRGAADAEAEADAAAVEAERVAAAKAARAEALARVAAAETARDAAAQVRAAAAGAPSCGAIAAAAIERCVVDEKGVAPADDARAEVAPRGDTEELLEKRRAPRDGAPTASRPRDAIERGVVDEKGVALVLGRFGARRVLGRFANHVLAAQEARVAAASAALTARRHTAAVNGWAHKWLFSPTARNFPCASLHRATATRPATT